MTILNPEKYITKLLPTSDYLDSLIIKQRKERFEQGYYTYIQNGCVCNFTNQDTQDITDKHFQYQQNLLDLLTYLEWSVFPEKAPKIRVSRGMFRDRTKEDIISGIQKILNRINREFYDNKLFTPIPDEVCFDYDYDYIRLYEHIDYICNRYVPEKCFGNVFDFTQESNEDKITQNNQSVYEPTNLVKLRGSIIVDADEDFDIEEVSRRRTPRPSTTYRQYSKPTPSDPITSIEDIQRLKEYFKKGRNKLICLRNYALFITGVSTGLRCIDLTSLGIEDVMDKDGNILDEISCCESKTNKMNHPKLNNEVKEVLKEYITARKLKYPDTTDDDILFASQNDGYNLDTHSVYHIMRKAQKDLNLPYHLGAHSLRKTFAYWTIRQHYYDQNIMFSLQEMLNHDSLKTTLHYSGHTKEHLSQMYDDMESIVNGTAVPAKIISPEEKKIDKILSIISKLEGETKDDENATE